MADDKLTSANSSDKKISCSFCGKSQEEVKKLIAGPNVYICNECIESCHDLIQEQALKEVVDEHQDWDYTPKELRDFLND